MKHLKRKGLSLGIVLMLVAMMFAGASMDVGAKNNASNNKDQKKQNTEDAPIKTPAALPEDVNAPEAVIYYDPDIKRILVEGVDESGEEVNVQETVLEETKQGTIILYTLTNAAGNSLDLTMKLRYDKNSQRAEAEIQKMSYNGGESIVFKSREVQYKVSIKKDRNTGELQGLTQQIGASTQFKAKTNYDVKKDLTKIDYQEGGKDRVEYDIGGLGLFNLVTACGQFTLTINIDGVEEQIEELKEGIQRTTPAQFEAYYDLELNSRTDVEVRLGDYSGVPEFLAGKWPTDPRLTTSAEKAEDFILTYGDLFRLDPNADSFSTEDLGTSRELGITNVKLQQEYLGIPVFGSELIVHLDKSNNVVFANGYFAADIDIGTTARITGESAQRFAESDLISKYSRIRILGVSTPTLSVYHTAALDRFGENINHLVWQMIIKTSDPEGIWYYMVCADDGAIVEAWDNSGSESSGMPWAKLLYQRQSGAINEAYNVILNETDDYRNPFSDPIWRGERDHMDNYLHVEGRCTPENDNCGVTENSAIITKLILLIAYGGAHYGYDIDGIGVKKTEQLLKFTQRESGLTCSATFKEYRDVMCKTGDNMVGGSTGMTQPDMNMVEDAFMAIGFRMIEQTFGGDTMDENDKFGWSLATGNFNRDAFEDIAIGVPYDDNTAINDGTVMVYYGSFYGLKVSGSEHLTQGHAGVTASNYDKFGYSLAAGDYNGDSFDDLAIGLPYKNLAGKSNSGQVIVFYGTYTGLLPDGLGDGPSIAPPPITERLSQSHAGEVNSNGDKFGWRLASGNFDGDGFDDLAVGMPYENDGKRDNGIVIIFYGAGQGLLPNGTFISPVDKSEILTQDDADLNDDADDRFGYSLAAGNFDGDSFTDLAVSVPYKRVGVKTETGCVIVFHGSEDGLLPVTDVEILYQYMDDRLENQNNDRFGFSLAAGDFNGDTIDDLAVGVPYKNYEEINDGIVVFFYGRNNYGFYYYPEGEYVIVFPPITDIFYQEIAYESSEEHDRFGYSLGVGDFDGDSYDDLAVGVPYERLYGLEKNGLINVLYGSELTNRSVDLSRRAYWLTQGYFGSSWQSKEKFGWALVSGDYNGDGKDELAAGSPYRDYYPDGEDAGAVYVKTLEPAMPWINARGSILYSRTDSCVLGIKNPDAIRPMASTTKIMTALIVIERSQLPTTHDDYLDLNGTVLVSQKAYEIGGSRMNLTLGDRVSLHDALYGLMLPSGNDAAVAIAEHILGDGAGDNGGAFSDLMNIRAAELGLTRTHFENPHGRHVSSHYSTARDLARLADFALEDPFFVQIVNTSTFTTTTWVDSYLIGKNKTLGNSNNFTRSWKDEYWDAVCGVKTGTTTPAGQCLVSRAKQSGEDIIGVVLFSTHYHGNDPDRYTDSRTILEYGFETDYPFL